MNWDFILKIKKVIKIFTRWPLFYRIYIKRASLKQIIYLIKSGFCLLTNKNFYPLSILLSVTYKCQCNCLHCGIIKYKNPIRKELSFEEIKGLILELKKLKVINITLTGGEPLLRKDIFKIIEFISGQGIIVTLDSNGLLLNLPTIIKLKNVGLNLVKVSIDSSNPKIHDAIRGVKDCFNKASKSVETLAKMKIPTVIQTVVSYKILQENELKKIINLAKKLRASGVCLQFPKASGKWQNYNFSDQRLENYIRNHLDKRYVYYSNLTADFLECPAISKSECYISSYGDLQPCMFMPLIFGNLREEKFETIYKRMLRHPLYSLPLNSCVVNKHNLKI